MKLFKFKPNTKEAEENFQSIEDIIPKYFEEDKTLWESVEEYFNIGLMIEILEKYNPLIDNDFNFSENGKYSWWCVQLFEFDMIGNNGFGDKSFTSKQLCDALFDALVWILESEE